MTHYPKRRTETGFQIEAGYPDGKKNTIVEQLEDPQQALDAARAVAARGDTCHAVVEGGHELLFICVCRPGKCTKFPDKCPGESSKLDDLELG